MVDRAALQPLARGYRAVTPEPARAAVSKCVWQPGRRGQCGQSPAARPVCPRQFRPDARRTEFHPGLGGLIDIATPAGLPSYKTGFGETLGRWGYQNSAMWCCRCWGLPPCATRSAAPPTLPAIRAPICCQNPPTPTWPRGEIAQPARQCTGTGPMLPTKPRWTNIVHPRRLPAIPPHPYRRSGQPGNERRTFHRRAGAPAPAK